MTTQGIKAKSSASQPPRDDLDAVSMHTTPEDDACNDAPELPSYDDSQAAALLPKPNTTLSVPPRDEFAALQPHTTASWQRECGSTSINVEETTIRMDPRLSEPDELRNYIGSYLGIVPPRPAIRVSGWHIEKVERNKSTETKKKVDFDILLGLEAYLPKAGGDAADEGRGTHAWRPRVATNDQEVHRGSWRKSRAKGYENDVEIGDQAQPTLSDWCTDFCNSDAKLKIFRVTRDLVGLDQDYMRRHLEAVVRSTGFRGHVEVAFPVSEKYVDIYSPHWINRWRTTAPVRWLFCLTFLWIFAWPLLFFFTRRWSVYRVDWHWSWMAHGEQLYASISEGQWVEKHSNLIRELALDRYRGDATVLSLNIRREESRAGRLPSAGTSNIDSAISIVHERAIVWNAIYSGIMPGRWSGEAERWGWDAT